MQVKQKIYIASDHAGYEMKNQIINELANDYEFIDLGTNSNESVDYPTYAFKLCENVLQNNCLGILICGTGFGMAIAANKVKGIRAVDIIDPKMAALAKEHNNCNVITLSGRFNTLENNIKIIKQFISAKYDGNSDVGKRHQRRIDLISKYEGSI